MIQRIQKYYRENKEFLTVIVPLNLAYLFSSLGDRLWSFATGLIMHKLGGLTWVAIHQLVEAGFKLSFATRVGSTLDKIDRSTGIQSILATNNISIVFSSICFFVMFIKFGNVISTGSQVVLTSAVILGAISRVASEAQKTAFTKDWLVVIIEKTEGARLSTQNALMNMIDQTAAFFAPIIAGYLIDQYPGQVCCVVLLVWNLISWAVEGVTLLWIYRSTPELAKKKELEKNPECCSFQMYFRQKAIRAMLGLAFLFMTVLGFDNLALSYGASQGMSGAQLGFFRSMGSLLGFAGNFVYTISERFTGVLITGLIGLIIQNIFINFCSLSVFLPGSPLDINAYFQNRTAAEHWGDILNNLLGGSNNGTTAHTEPLPFSQLSPSMIVFFVGITAARFGLWMADPSIGQVMQETIPESERYTVNAVQNIFCELFSMLKDIIVILLPASETFGILIIGSCCFVFLGFLFYLSYFINTYSCAGNNKEMTENGQEMGEIPEREKLMGESLVDHALKLA